MRFALNRIVGLPVTRRVSFSMSDSWRDSLSCRVTATGMELWQKSADTFNTLNLPIGRIYGRKNSKPLVVNVNTAGKPEQ